MSQSDQPLNAQALEEQAQPNTADWCPDLSAEHISKRQAVALKRSWMYQQIRAYFWGHHFCEVETPLISSAASTEPHLASIRVTPWQNSQAQESCNPVGFASQPEPDEPRLKTSGFLITSPEYPMKRLMAEWQRPIFQITKCFRALEQSRRHNPEFSMLEWYRPHATLKQIERDLLALLERLSGKPVILERISYAQAFARETGLDPFTLSMEEAQAFALRDNLSFPRDLDRLGWVDLIFSLRVEPKLGASKAAKNPHSSDTAQANQSNDNDGKPTLKATLIHDFLPEQASLAQTRCDASGRCVAQRFELYINGLEIANAAEELIDPVIQLERFKQDNQTREALGLPAMPIDHELIAAMQSLPPCSGIAVGLDRLLMVLGGHESISEVLLFDATRA